MTHLNGSMENGREEMLPALIAELVRADVEHSDILVEHESGWGVSVSARRRVILENVERDEPPRFLIFTTDADCLRIMQSVARGATNDLLKLDWAEGYS